MSLTICQLPISRITNDLECEASHTSAIHQFTKKPAASTHSTHILAHNWEMEVYNPVWVPNAETLMSQHFLRTKPHSIAGHEKTPVYTVTPIRTITIHVPTISGILGNPNRPQVLLHQSTDHSSEPNSYSHYPHKQSQSHKHRDNLSIHSFIHSFTKKNLIIKNKKSPPTNNT